MEDCYNQEKCAREVARIKLLLHFKEKPFYSFAKRLFDIFGSAIAILVFLLPMLIIGAMVKAQDGGPVFYNSKRVGRGGAIFTMFKFRTMIVGAEKQLDKLLNNNETNGKTFKMKDDPRITKIGKFLRKTSLDELPQLFNVFLGSMSFVGPRPALPREVALYSQDIEYQRLLVKQGITCVWQVSGRSLTTFEEQMEMDKEYVNRRSLFLDCSLLLKTFPAVLSKKGAE